MNLKTPLTESIAHQREPLVLLTQLLVFPGFVKHDIGEHFGSMI